MIPKRLAVFVLPLILIGCKEKAMDPTAAAYQRLQGVPQEKWDTLAEKKIYFGHQSVGRNILDGLATVLEKHPSIRLEVRETTDAADFEGPVFAHSPIGRNRDPKGKIDSFREILDSGIGEKADIAFFKLCYVDIERATDVADLVDYYDGALAELRGQYPDLTVIPVTGPLTNAAPGVKPLVKRILGMGPAIKADNIRRNAFNDHIRRKYSSLLWDLADAEATTPEGAKVTFEEGGRAFQLLNKAYTGDGGHLNAIGSQIVAIDLLLRLAALD